MNDQMQKVLSEYMETLLSSLKQGAAIAGDQIPLIVKEKLAFDFWMAITWLVAGILLIGMSAGMFVWCNRICEARKNYEPDAGLGQFIIGVLGVLVGVPALFINLQTVIQISIAPRLYIIDWVMGMVKH